MILIDKCCVYLIFYFRRVVEKHGIWIDSFEQLFWGLVGTVCYLKTNEGFNWWIRWIPEGNLLGSIDKSAGVDSTVFWDEIRAIENWTGQIGLCDTTIDLIPSFAFWSIEIHWAITSSRTVQTHLCKILKTIKTKKTKQLQFLNQSHSFCLYNSPKEPLVQPHTRHLNTVFHYLYPLPRALFLDYKEFRFIVGWFIEAIFIFSSS